MAADRIKDVREAAFWRKHRKLSLKCLTLESLKGIQGEMVSTITGAQERNGIWKQIFGDQPQRSDGSAEWVKC